jgi:type IV secretion system protein VirD4
MNRSFNNKIGPDVRGIRQKISFIPLFTVLVIILSLQSATQYFAAYFSYQEALGSNFFYLYFPWSIISWFQSFDSRYYQAFMEATTVGGVVGILGFLIIVIVNSFKFNSSKVFQYLHGSARWADLSDIEASGLLSNHNSGVYVGGWVDKRGVQHYLRHSGPEHVLCYAPTRSGKGVGLVVPTLLSWEESVVITDLKGELWSLTSGWRKKYAKNMVLRFEPAAIDSGIAWNPLDEIRTGTEYEVGDAQNLALLIVDPNGRGLESHWQKTSMSLIVGLILHVLYKAKNEGFIASLPSIDSMLANPERDVAEIWVEMTKYEHFEEKTHPVVSAAGRDMIDRAHEEATSVLSTVKSYLALYRDPVVAKNISHSDFRIKDLMHNENPISLYIVTQPNDKARLRPLVRIMVNMIIRLLADRIEFSEGKPKAHYKHKLLMMLDEFASLGNLEIFQESLAFIAGYGIKCYLIVQDINQLKSRETGYGPDESITSNCHVQNAFPPNRLETAEYLSKLTGVTTVVKEHITTSGRRAGALLNQVSKTINEVQRPLLTADECLRMKGPKKNAKGEILEAGDMVVYVAGYPAIYGRQPLYFKDPVFNKRAAVPSPKESDVLNSNALQLKDDERIAL